MDDQVLTIRIEAEDGFSPAFDALAADLEATQGSLKDTAGVYAQMQDAAQAAFGDTARLAQDAAAEEVNWQASVQRGRSTLEGLALPPSARAAVNAYHKGNDLSAFAADQGVDLNNAAGHLSDLTGGLTSGLTGGMLAGGAGAGLALLMQNPVMQQELAKLNAALQALITPLAEAIAPALDALVPVLHELKPLFELIGEALKTSLQPLVWELGLVSDAVHGLETILHPVEDALDGLKDAIESFNPFPNLGGGGDGPHLDIGGVRIFDSGGTVGPLDGLMPAGMPGHRLVVAQLGERIVPPGQAAGGGSSVGAPVTIHFHQALAGPDIAQKVRQIVQELHAQNQLGWVR